MTAPTATTILADLKATTAADQRAWLAEALARGAE